MKTKIPETFHSIHEIRAYSISCHEYTIIYQISARSAGWLISSDPYSYA
jgi:hypothetical protein